MQYYKDIEKFIKGKKVFCGIDIHLNFGLFVFIVMESYWKKLTEKDQP